MSFVTVTQVKSYLRVIHTSDDTLLQELIDQAEDESLRFLNRTEPPTLPLDYPAESSSEDEPSSDDPVAPSFRKAVFLLVQASYEMPSGDERDKVRRAAETVLMPYRTGLGV